MDQCRLCKRLEDARGEAERAWATAKARLVTVTRSCDAEEYIRLRGVEMTAQVEADLARIELEMHQKAHREDNAIQL
jgi:hypothetical protein